MIDFKDPEFQAFLNQIIEKKIEEHEAKKDPVEELLKLLKNPRVIAFLDEHLVTSELRPVQRLRQLEEVTGIYAFEEWEEHPATIPERLEALEQKSILAPESTPEEPKEDNPLIDNTTLTKKAQALTDYLKSQKPSWSGKVVLEGQEICKFFFEKIDQELRWPAKLKGYRGAKKTIIERAQELYPDQVQVVKNKSGNKITGIALKPCVKRMDTYGC